LERTSTAPIGPTLRQLGQAHQCLSALFSGHSFWLKIFQFQLGKPLAQPPQMGVSVGAKRGAPNWAFGLGARELQI